jgi:hypothetical protein
MSASDRAVSPRRTIFAGAAVSLLLALGGASPAAAAGPSLYADGLHIPAGGLVDPDNRVWVSDHNGGFCRLSPADDRGPGTIEHPSAPGAPDDALRTCLGGLLPEASVGPDAAGQPALADPTPLFPGSGDEIALIPDGASPSMDVWRARWNPDTRLFEADPSDVVKMNADTAEDRPRPTAVALAPDGNAYVVFQRSSSIQRIVDPAGSSAPQVELVGHTSDANGSQAVAAGFGPMGAMGPPTVYVGEVAGIREIAGTPGDANRITSPSAFSAGVNAEGPIVASTLAYQVTDAGAGQGTLYAGTAEAAAPLVLPGPDQLLRLNANADPTVIASGFSTIGGMAIRPADGALFAFDDPAIAIDAEPLGRGRAFVIGDLFTDILSGPSQKEGQPALDPEYTADSTPTFTYAGEFDRQCSLTPADAAANNWQPCDATSYTASGTAADGGLTDGRYRFAVRSVNGTVVGQADSQYFTLDTVAPTATPVILNPKHDSTHLRSPRFSFDNDVAEGAPEEPEFGYQCKIDGGEYAACDEGPSGLADGEHTLQIKLVDGAGNVGTVESDSTATVENDPATADEDESAGTTGAQATRFTVGTAPVDTDTDPTPYAEMTHPNSASVYGKGLHIATGAMEDPAGRVWVTDHNAGFCRMTDPTIEAAGRIEHPEVPNQPRREARTCLGGLLPDAGPGADAAGPPTFVDPTPKRPGSGDEVVVMADGFAHSNFLVRFRWDPGTELFEYLDQITVPAIERPEQDRPRPVTTQLGPDPDGIDGPKQPSVFFVNMRDVYIGRVDNPAGDNPEVHIAGYVTAGNDRAEVLAVGQRDEVVQEAGEGSDEVTEKRPVIYIAGAEGIDRLENPRVEGEDDAPTTLTTTPVAIPGVGSPGAMTYDLQRDLLYVGTADGIVEDPVTDEITSITGGVDRLLRIDPATMQTVGDPVGGFSMIGGLGLRNDGRILVVDDKALLDEAEPMAEGVMYQIGLPAARIASGPSDPEGDALDPTYTSSPTPSFTLAGDTPRECWVRPADSATAPAWVPCDEGTFTTASLLDGTYKLTVRATAGSTAGTITDTSRYVPHTQRFTVDTVAPAQPSVTGIAPLSSDGVTSAAPFFTFAGEAGVRYGCRLNSDTYNKVPCRPGRTFPLSGTVRVQDGANTLYINATDKAGNASPESPAFRFEADTSIPEVTISSPEEGQRTAREVTFVFKASQLQNTVYACRLDGVAFHRCDRPSDAGGAGRPVAIQKLADGTVTATYRELSDGAHRFQVHAADNHGNVSPNATRNIRVDVSTPVVPAPSDPPAQNRVTGTSVGPVRELDTVENAISPRLVPVAISQPVLRTIGLPVTFIAAPDTALARIQIFRVAGPGTVATAARAAATSRKATSRKAAKRLLTLTRKTPRPGLYRLLLKERAIGRLLKPGAYRVEVALRTATGRYGRPRGASLRVKSGKKRMQELTAKRAGKKK